MRLRLAIASLVAASLVGAAAHADASPTASWAQPQIAQVVAAGLMGPDVASFRPDDSLTRGELHEAILALGKPHTAPLDPDRVVTIRELDAQLVGALGLVPSSYAIRLAAREAGLEPTGMLGTETVARLLGLRINHPQASEALERRPSEPASRAEAAFSLARVLTLDPTRLQTVVNIPQSFLLPSLTEWQRQILARALRLVGYPYVFAGTSERRVQRLWSSAGQVDAPGGFDCSGFVWRVYKLDPFVDAPWLSDVLKGRTTYEMSGEVPRVGPDPTRRGRGGRRRVLRIARHEVDARPGRAHGDRARQRLVRALLGQRGDVAAARGLVRDELRLGAPAAGRSRARVVVGEGLAAPASFQEL